MKSCVAFFVPSLLPIAAQDAWGGWECTAESGYLWGLGTDTDADYEIIPTVLTLRSPVVWNWWEGGNGDSLTVRSRYSLLMEAFTKGPEDYYFGLAAAPSIEYAFASGESTLFLSIGGGAGWTNSAGGTEGQGQDFTLNWLAQFGLRHELTEKVSVLGSVFFIHHSNGGMTDPNPGIDALGFTLGLSWPLD